ncbi:hypothetical protein [Undibacterium sp. TS12]|uniref:hypothetical protein n=1 Tax=Undibacterium sp. TS12 TaxID=2908202 RepID=UPI001F4D256F|nr:hypothetical protein [Undibacterium sp. TS12]MCH8618034.1 hypothetical protein [Undibacterium sp. TS12]
MWINAKSEKGTKLHRNRSPWTIDASSVGGVEDLNHIDLILNDALKRFLEISPDKHRSVLVAGKGQGKTLALLYKSSKYRKEDIKCLPTGDNLIERIPSFHLKPTEHELIKSLSEKEDWGLIWEVSIAAALMCLFKDDGNQDSVFGTLFRTATNQRINSENVANYALWLIQSHNNVEAARKALPLVREYVQKLNEEIGVFIDNIDEALEEFCDPLHFSDIAAGIDTTNIWVSSQLGLVDAIAQYKKHSPKIKVSATIRIEAYNKRTSNLDEFCEILQYNTHDLRKIFDLNVEMEDEKSVACPSETDMITRFFGRKSFSHDRVVSNENVPVEEGIFECILRHTLGRPRDLMRIGGYIARHCLPSERSNDKKLRDAIRAGAAEVFEKYKGESFPRWDDSYDLFLEFFPSNVVTRAQMNRMANAFELKYSDKTHPGCYYYQRGLLGTNREQRQFFLPPNTFPASDIRIPTKDCFYLHPCMTVALHDARMKSEVCKSQFSDQILCGQGLPKSQGAAEFPQLKRFRFGIRENCFWFELDGIDLPLPRGNSHPRLLLAIILRSAMEHGKDLMMNEHLNPVAQKLAQDLPPDDSLNSWNSATTPTLMHMFNQSKVKSGVPALKKINEVLNEYPFCCNNGSYNATKDEGNGRGPITWKKSDQRGTNAYLYLGVCRSSEIEEVKDTTATNGL